MNLYTEIEVEMEAVIPFDSACVKGTEGYALRIEKNTYMEDLVESYRPLVEELLGSFYVENRSLYALAQGLNKKDFFVERFGGGMTYRDFGFYMFIFESFEGSQIKEIVEEFEMKKQIYSEKSKLLTSANKKLEWTTVIDLETDWESINPITEEKGTGNYKDALKRSKEIKATVKWRRRLFEELLGSFYVEDRTKWAFNQKKFESVFIRWNQNMSNRDAGFYAFLYSTEGKRIDEILYSIAETRRLYSALEKIVKEHEEALVSA